MTPIGRRPWRRRSLLRGLGVLAIAAGAGLLRPIAGLAANFPFPRRAFEREDLDAAMEEALGTTDVPAGHVTLTAPTLAENGAVVPLTLESDLDDVARFHVFVPGNPMPYVARLHLPGAIPPKAELRIKMDQTSAVHGVAETGDGRLYRGSKRIEVTISGCRD